VGVFAFVRGVDILKIYKIPLVYSVSCFNLGGLELYLGELSPPKPSRELCSGLDTCNTVPFLHEVSAVIGAT